jgi:hypothetical protein
MPRACTVCGHPERHAIDEALFRNNIPFRNVSKRYQVTVSALFRHKQHTPVAEQQNAGRKAEITEHEVRRSVQLTASLPPKKQAYVEGRLAGKSKKQAALAAGFSESMASHATDKIETKDVREAFAALIRETIPPERITKAISEGLDAMETKFFSSEGEVRDSRDVIAWSERRQYAELAAEYGGYHAPDKGDREQGGGGVILILPDSPRPAPVIEAKVVDVPSEANGPMLILPDAPKGEAGA